MTNAESITPTELNDLIRQKLSKPEADLLCRSLDYLPRSDRPVWNVRAAKARLTELMASARTDEPQLLLREGDELPLMLVSLRSICRLINRGATDLSFTDSMLPFMKETTASLQIRDSGQQDRLRLSDPPAVEAEPALVRRRDREPSSTPGSAAAI